MTTEKDVQDSPISKRAEEICQKRYYQKDKDGNPIEDWNALITRVINHVCKKENEEFKEAIHYLMLNTFFLPNSPCLVNAGSKSKSKKKNTKVSISFKRGEED